MKATEAKGLFALIASVGGYLMNCLTEIIIVLAILMIVDYVLGVTVVLFSGQWARISPRATQRRRGIRAGCGLYYSDKGKAMMEPITKEISDLTPWSDVGLKYRDNLSALKYTKAVAGILEVSFHDNCCLAIILG